MQSRLVGMAKTWYHGLLNYNLTWEEWKALIKRCFPDHTNYATLLRTMLNRRKLDTEPMTTYYFGKMELLRSCEISGKQAVSCLIYGIDDSVIQNSARAGRYHTPEALCEEYLSALNVDAPSPSGTPKEKQFKPSKPADIRNTLKNRHTKFVTKCVNCGQRGHIATRCAKPRKECRKCRLLGHEEQNCPRKFNKSGESQPFLNIDSMKNTSNNGLLFYRLLYK